MTAPDAPIRIGISSCLLGEKVRYDGGHKRDGFLTDVLGPHVTWVPVCPELEVGMGVPREPVRLAGSASSPRMVGVTSGTDWTAQMRRYAERRAEQLAGLGLCGYILKSGSPSCGMERVKVYGENGMPAKQGRGLFAAAFMKANPLVPAEEEGRLNDVRLRENFIVRVFASHRLQQLFARPFTRGRLVEFHTNEKYLMLAHSPKHYTELGRLVAGKDALSPGILRERYAALYMSGLSVRTTTRKNVNVLHHMLGFLKKQLTPGEKLSILDAIGDYQKELIPLIVPLTLLRHFIDAHEVSYIQNQVYLHPHPKELMLRNHV